jgi:hypothetical protein
MSLPPLLTGASQVNATDSLSGVAVTEVGASGLPDTGVTAPEISDGSDGPAALMARTLNVYGLPLSIPSSILHSVTLPSTGMIVPSSSSIS